MSIFSYVSVDRNALIRPHDSPLNELRQSVNSRFLIWYQGKLIKPDTLSLYFSYDNIAALEQQLSQPVYLGKHETTHYFTYQLNQWHTLFDGLELMGLRSASLIIEDYHLGLLYYSQGMLNWHQTHSYCSNCGSSTHITHSGHERKCDNADCHRSHYPKIDPAVIFSVINNSGTESKILLARQSHWSENKHSVLAGFVEPGETLEDAVKREAFEETGLKVKNINYMGSQPWPFPGQIMLGFSCETEQWDIDLRDHELESAGWFSASDIEQKVKAETLKMPFKASISWELVNYWVARQRTMDKESMGLRIKTD